MARRWLIRSAALAFLLRWAPGVLFAVQAPSGRLLPKKPKNLDKKQEYDVPGTLYQGGRRGIQFFLGDLVEVQRDSEWVSARVSRAPTDERPNDGSFRVKFDTDAYEMKCWYRDLRKPKNPEKIPMPEWVEDWWPEEPAPEPDYVGNESDPELNFVIKGPFPKEYTEEEMFWRQGPPENAYEITAEERQQDAERWADFNEKEAERKRLEEERRKAFEESERKWAEEEAKKKKAEKKVKKVKVKDPEEEEEEMKKRRKKMKKRRKMKRRKRALRPRLTTWSRLP
ncbi:unnamed protein product [Effrenium voratum]|uniref:Uncharacterized protein n=1 Tax=Effrenium voratum TaxID=2562239 RepID=A0AA36IPK4_9DINO|nr:unnamed protein product [Effrenium voratum]